MRAATITVFVLRCMNPFKERAPGLQRKIGKARPLYKDSAGWLWLALLLFFSVLMLRITWQYFPIRDDIAFLRIKQEYLPIIEWKVAFFIHVFTSMFALAAGFTQFSRAILRGVPAMHRWVGRLYVLDVVFVTGPASFIMAIYANGGLTSKLAFGILAVLWIGFTAAAFLAIRKRRIQEHRQWMIRSYALTISAVTLRAWKYGLVFLFNPAPMDVYRLVAWLGWVPNLILAEYLIRRVSSRTTAISDNLDNAPPPSHSASPRSEEALPPR